MAADDLQRILGYADAVDERTGTTVLAQDLVIVPCWTPEFCASLVRAAEAAGGFAAADGDPVPGSEISLMTISPRLFETVTNDMGRRIWPQLRRHWPMIEYHGIRDAFVITYRPGEQEELRLHHDVAQVSASIKLNDGYSGAVLEFPQQGADNSSVPVGSLLAWPSLVTHPHRSTQITEGTKYSLTIWFELPISLD